MKIIEVTGCPCAGKSTSLKVCFSSEKPFFSEKNIYGNPYSAKLSSKYILCRIFYFIRGFFFSSPLLIKFLIEKVFLSENRAFHRCRIIFNIFLKIGRAKSLLHNSINDIVVIDEGVSHIPYNLMLSHRDTVKFLSLLPSAFSDIVVIHIREDADIIRERLVKRGHARVDVTCNNSVSVFLANNFSVINSIKLAYPNFFHIFLEVKNNDLLCHFEEIIRRFDSQ